jgi:hypothetical protein
MCSGNVIAPLVEETCISLPQLFGNDIGMKIRMLRLTLAADSDRMDQYSTSV